MGEMRDGLCQQVTREHDEVLREGRPDRAQRSAGWSSFVEVRADTALGRSDDEPL